MEVNEFLNLKFPTWIETIENHENNTTFRHILNARKPTKNEKKHYAVTPAVVIEYDFVIEQHFKSDIDYFFVAQDNHKEGILIEKDIADSKKKRVLPKFMRSLTIKYIFEGKSSPI